MIDYDELRQMLVDFISVSNMTTEGNKIVDIRDFRDMLTKRVNFDEAKKVLRYYLDLNKRRKPKQIKSQEATDWCWEMLTWGVVSSSQFTVYYIQGKPMFVGVTK